MLNVSVVGTGYWGKNYVRLLHDLPEAKLVSVCDVNEQAVLHFQGKYGVKPVTDCNEVAKDGEVEAVVIATPASTHFDTVSLFLKAGKHVLVEKPITTSSSEGHQLCQLAKEHNVSLVVGHTFLFNSGIAKMKELLGKQEEFGKLYYMYATRTNMGPVRSDVNAAWDLAPHDVSIFLHLVSSKPVSVSAVGNKVLGNTLADVVFITITFENGVVGHIHVSWVDPHKVRRVTVVGSMQRIEFDDMNNLERIRIFNKGVSPYPEDDGFDDFASFKLAMEDGDIVSPKIKPSEPLKDQVLHFIECVKNGKQSYSSGEFGVDVVRVMEAIDASCAKAGAPVTLA